MDQSLDTIVNHIVAAGRVTPDDTLTLRQTVWPDGRIELPEAEVICAINLAAKKQCPQWVDFFVEAISTFLVDQAEPRGHVDDVKSDWLISQIGQNGEIQTRTELLLLVAILERATNVSDTLKSFVLAQVEKTVLTGEGPTRIGTVARPGIVDETEIALLRRVLYAPASDGAAVISESEARALFRIKDATLGNDNAPGWPTLFVQLVGNHLMAHSSYVQLSPERAAALDAFMADTSPNIGKFLARMEAAFLSPTQVVSSLPSTDDASEDASEDALDAAIAADRAITVDEANWLKAHIVADGVIDDIEKALLAFILDELGPLPSELAPLAAETPEPWAMSA